jgi:uridine phosphorylase
MTIDVTTVFPSSHLRREGLPARALVVGDPARATMISGLLEGADRLAAHREYLSYRGRWSGTDVLVSSHGVGAAGSLQLFRELIAAGVGTIIRLGGAGSVAPGIENGDIVIAEAAVRDDGVSDQIVPPQYPAFSTPEVVVALEEAARAHEVTYHRGIVWTRALFEEMVLPVADPVYKKAGVAAIEMEMSALFVACSLRNVRCGGLVVINGTIDDEVFNPYTEVVARATQRAAEVALDALHFLCE